MRAYIIPVRTDCPGAGLQVLDLVPNTSQMSSIYDGPGQTFYLHGVSPVLDSNGELDPGELGPTDNENEWTLRFSRFGASFDPTSPLLTGNYVYSRQLNAPGMFGPGTVTNSQCHVSVK